MNKENKPILPLTMVGTGKEVVLSAITGGKRLRQRLTDMGLTKGRTFKLIQSFKPGPCIIRIGDTRLVLGHGMCRKIMVVEKE
jgi:ferrous iron transport protein A